MPADNSLPVEPAWLDLAITALCRSMDGDLSAAGDRLVDLLDIYGTGVLYDVMTSWVLTTAAAQGVTPGVAVALLPQQVGTYRTLDIASLSPYERWAAWFMSARVSGDRDTLRALVEMLDCPDAVTRGALTLLDMCGHTLRMVRGAA